MAGCGGNRQNTQTRRDGLHPLHAYPHDYWRFSREAMETLFSDENGFCNQQSWYDFPASALSDSIPALAAGISECQHRCYPALDNPENAIADDRWQRNGVRVPPCELPSIAEAACTMTLTRD